MKRPIVKQHDSLKLLAAAVFTAAAALGASQASAQSLTSAEAQQRYQTDVERCRSGQSSQDQQTCLREAGAALQEARRNRLVTGTPTFDENQRARCDRLSGTERDDCMRLMSDPNAVVHGSIEGGGIIRETTITVPAEPGYAPASPDGLSPAPAGSMPSQSGGGLQPGAGTPDQGSGSGTYAPAGGGLTTPPAR